MTPPLDAATPPPAPDAYAAAADAAAATPPPFTLAATMPLLRYATQRAAERYLRHAFRCFFDADACRLCRCNAVRDAFRYAAAPQARCAMLRHCRYARGEMPLLRHTLLDALPCCRR